ncbi:hypothetical protein PM082_019166 [Marasmius tenuissimus]|nr:hypothetical protein PM082_019166 [Marasmius tenuissimus]
MISLSLCPTLLTILLLGPTSCTLSSTLVYKLARNTILPQRFVHHRLRLSAFSLSPAPCSIATGYIMVSRILSVFLQPVWHV